MTIYLVRHGLDVGSGAEMDPRLAPLGHEQAAAAAEALHGIDAARLIVSPLRRTQETAIPIAAALGLEPEIREEVAEVFDPSMPIAERRAMIGPFMAGNWAEQSAHLRQWRQRVADTVLGLGLTTAASGRDLVIVSHYIAISVIIGEATSDDRVVPVPMANAAITRLEVLEGRFLLLEAAGTAHLRPELLGGAGSATPGRA